MRTDYSQKSLEIPKEILNLIPARIATQYKVLPLGMENGVLKLASPSGLSRTAKDELKVMLGQKIDFVAMEKQEIEMWIEKAYGVGAGVIETLTLDEISETVDQDIEVIDQAAGCDPTVITLVNELFLDALKRRASDIHIEPFDKRLRIRYRVDGRLYEARVSENIRMLAPHLISRIKIMAKLDIGEKRLSQDGRIKIKQKNEELDLRVSVLPSSFGEAIVIRILKSLKLLLLEDLGFEERAILQIRTFLRKPHGVILLTGPTGSGKTTTLYACLKELNQTERKVITIEDPIEYKLTGIIQMQVNPKIKWTFVSALRAILRHDPDCIMIGEIRDSETAEIAIRAALTGHLVFSTLHTNDAPSAIMRLIEMGIEPYLVSSALEAVIAQRLVRKYCASCKGSGCGHCEGAGFFDRFAIAEIMPITDRMRDLILERKPVSLLRNIAVEAGMKSLFDDGLEKVKQGLTSEEEVRRIV